MIETFMNLIQNFHLSISTVFDIGSRDGLQSIEFLKYYPNAEIYAFECNPKTIPICKKNIEKYSNIRLIDKCVFNYNGTINFYPTNDKTITTWPDFNPGASSVFKANGKYDHIEKYVQDKITVDCMRLDTWMANKKIKKVDLIWMDLQGSELQALEGLGNYIDDVQIIHTEVEINPMYDNQSLFPEIDKFLKLKKFKLIYPEVIPQGDQVFGIDVVYIKEGLQ